MLFLFCFTQSFFIPAGESGLLSLNIVSPLSVIILYGFFTLSVTLWVSPNSQATKGILSSSSRRSCKDLLVRFFCVLPFFLDLFSFHFVLDFCSDGLEIMGFPTYSLSPFLQPESVKKGTPFFETHLYIVPDQPGVGAIMAKRKAIINKVPVLGVT